MTRAPSHRLRIAVLLSSVLTTVGMFVAPIGATAAPGGGTSVCTSISELAPVQRDHTVNQGVGAYTTLAPGKQTLVRAYLSMPTCADADDRVVVTSAQLEYVATSGGAAAFSGVVDAPTPELPATGAALPPSGVAPVGGRSVSDPLFVLRGNELPPSTFTSGASFDVSYQLRVTYQASLNGGPLSAPTTMTLPAFQASFAPQQRPISVLVVPLVDGTVFDPTKRFPASAVESVVAAMDTLNRELPVASGVRNDFVENAGIRYAFHPAGLDLRHVGPSPQHPLGKDLMEDDGTYCGDDSSLLRRELDKVRLIYNGAVNYTKDAVFDRVLGVVPPTLVSSDCAIAGYADYPGAAAYIAIDPARPNTGSLATLEIAHTLHLVDPNSPNRNVSSTSNDPTHSKNTEADFADRAFDTHGLIQIGSSADRSVMRYTTDASWRDDVTLLEAREWTYALCRLQPGGVLGQLSCPDPARPGGSAAAAGERFAIVGHTDGTPGGTVADSHTQAEGVSDVTDPSSDYRLLAIGSGGVLANYGVPVTGTHSHHGHDHDGTEHVDLVSFSLSIPSQDGTHFELWHGDPQADPSAVLLYARDRNDAPVIDATSTTTTIGEPHNVTESVDTDDSRPALSPDGTVLAWRAGGGMRLLDLAAGGEPSADFDGVEAAWSKDGERLAWTTQSGEVMVGNVDRTSGTPRLADIHPVYYPTGAGLTFPASGVSWSPDGTSVVSSIDGDLWQLDADPALFLTPACVLVRIDLCPRLTSTAVVERDPDWSHHGDVAYERDGEVWALSPESPTTTQRFVLSDAADPSWGHDQLAFVRGGAVWTARVTPTGVIGTSVVVESATEPAFSDDGAGLAFSSGAPSPRDVYVSGSSQRTTRVQVTDDAPETLRASLIASCPAIDDGLIAFAHPVSSDGTGATFELSYDVTSACDGAMFRVDVSDGVSVTSADAGHGGSDHAPVPAISTPLTSATVLQHRPLALVGGVTDADGDADEAGLVWSLTAPDGTLTSGVATGSTPEALAAPVLGWPVGENVITLTAMDASGNVATTSRTVTVLEDRDGDGIPAQLETGSCFGPDADGDASNAYGDPDGDGIANVVDDEPCQALTTVTVDFEPDVLYVPSSGTPVTVVVPKASGAVGAVDPTSVRISRVGAWTVHQPASSFELDKRGNGIAKFDRQQLTTFLSDKGYVGGYVRITVSWVAAGTTYHGVDPNGPVTSPS